MTVTFFASKEVSWIPLFVTSHYCTKGGQLDSLVRDVTFLNQSRSVESPCWGRHLFWAPEEWSERLRNQKFARPNWILARGSLPSPSIPKLWPGIFVRTQLLMGWDSLDLICFFPTELFFLTSHWQNIPSLLTLKFNLYLGKQVKFCSFCPCTNLAFLFLLLS